MVAAVKNEGKTAFVTDYLNKNKQANHREVSQAWSSAGNEGTVSESLVNKLRSKLGLTGNLQSRTKAAGSNGTAEVPQAASKPRGRPRKSGKTKGGTPAQANGSHDRAAPATGGGPTRLLTQLEGEIDDMLYRIKRAGGLAEFEETLRKARRILVRSHEE
jgi:hypothetical protein